MCGAGAVLRTGNNTGGDTESGGLRQRKKSPRRSGAAQRRQGGDLRASSAGAGGDAGLHLSGGNFSGGRHMGSGQAGNERPCLCRGRACAKKPRRARSPGAYLRSGGGPGRGGSGDYFARKAGAGTRPAFAAAYRSVPYHGAPHASDGGAGQPLYGGRGRRLLLSVRGHERLQRGPFPDLGAGGPRPSEAGEKATGKGEGTSVSGIPGRDGALSSLVPGEKPRDPLPEISALCRLLGGEEEGPCGFVEPLLPSERISLSAPWAGGDSLPDEGESYQEQPEYCGGKAGPVGQEAGGKIFMPERRAGGDRFWPRPPARIGGGGSKGALRHGFTVDYAGGGLPLLYGGKACLLLPQREVPRS